MQAPGNKYKNKFIFVLVITNDTSLPQGLHVRNHIIPHHRDKDTVYGMQYRGIGKFVRYIEGSLYRGSVPYILL